MLHDQGHITANFSAHNATAGLTVGTPILFSSVAHGTGSAFDIARRRFRQPGRDDRSNEAIVCGARGCESRVVIRP